MNNALRKTALRFVAPGGLGLRPRAAGPPDFFSRFGSLPGPAPAPSPSGTSLTPTEGPASTDDPIFGRTMKRSARSRPPHRCKRGVTKETVGRAEIVHVGSQRDPARIVRYYQEPDLNIHPSKTDTFTSATLESLATESPGISTTWKSGIPQRIQDRRTVFRVPGRDPEALGREIDWLHSRESAWRNMGPDARQDDATRFTRRRYADASLDWYNSIPLKE